MAANISLIQLTSTASFIPFEADDESADYPWPADSGSLSETTFNPDYSIHNYSDYSPIWHRRPPLEVAIKSVVVALIMAIGIFGNGVLIFLILNSKKLRRSPVNLFILNMAIADLLAVLYLPWVSLLSDIYQNYELGPFFCKTQCFCKVLFLLASVFSLVIISLDRLIMVIKPFWRQLTTTMSVVIIFIIWFFSFLFALPFLIWREYMTRQWRDYLETWCAEIELDYSRHYWFIMLVFLVYFPTFVMTGVYGFILCKLEKFERDTNNEEAKSPESRVKLQYRRVLLKMLFIYLLTTIICWFPLQVAVYYRNNVLYQHANLPAWYGQLCFLANVFATVNAAANPIVAFFQTFKQDFNKLLVSILKRRKSSRIGPSEIEAIPSRVVINLNDQPNNVFTISNGTTTKNTTTSFTRQILMKRAPQIFLTRDDT